jgi:hypothetical protein
VSYSFSFSFLFSHFSKKKDEILQKDKRGEREKKRMKHE